MEAAFTWISELASWIGSFIPTWIHVECWEVAVSITRGDKVVELPPGIHWYWPYWTTIHRRAANRQTKLVRSQELLTKDNETIAAGCMVRYTIYDGIKALVETDDVEGSIDDETMAALCAFITQRDLSEVNKTRSSANTQLTLRTKSQLEPYGVRVEKAQLTVFTKGQTLIHVGQIPTQVVEEV